jgi:hypothetical protein
MLTFRDTHDTDEESEEYRLASSRTPSPVSESDEDWINTPAFKFRAEQRRLQAEKDFSYSHTPFKSLDSKFYKSLAQINSSLDSYPLLKQGWQRHVQKQHELELFQEKEYDALISIIKDLEVITEFITE